MDIEKLNDRIPDYCDNIEVHTAVLKTVSRLPEDVQKYACGRCVFLALADYGMVLPGCITYPHSSESVEMFEHMRNHATLLSRIHEWLRPGGKLFVHVFCHRELTYLFEDQGEQDWMSRYFFTGGMMPGWDWLPECAGKLSLDERWAVNGEHYGKTLEAWLALADLRQETLVPLLDECYGPGQGKVWLQRWRMFFMACAELFNYRGGEEWFVAHYRFCRPQ